MQLGELKTALSRMPEDMADLEVIIQVVDKSGETIFENLVFVGVTQEDPECVLLGGTEAYLVLKNNEKNL